ncbi:hypothetical protein V9T40_000084 [Parthenolecanium corni]|uniref:Integrase catalytic domain-containing protein n=1 Tax=Parthenolecanium corni TaxID=536013 RepID=A0AAN9Y476_9HEMI
MSLKEKWHRMSGHIDFNKLKVLCEEYVNLVENLTGKGIKEIRCDNGTEYINKNVADFVKNCGVYLRPCIPYVHALNGTAERYNNILLDKACCLQAQARVDRRYWPECINAAAYLTNQSPASTIERRTPFEIFFKKKPDVSNLTLYGSRVFTRVLDVRRRSKWDRKADRGILLGYTDLGYRVLVNNRVIVTRHVDFFDENIKVISLRDDKLDEARKSGEQNIASQDDANIPVNEENVVQEDEVAG